MQKFAWLFPFAAFFLPLALYVRTLAPTYIPIDSAEFTVCMYTWGICHPPGFPLYIALGHFFLKIFTLGTVAMRANLFSAIFGALTIWLLYLVLVRIRTDKILALFAALLLAVSSTFWEFSISADVFTFGAFLLLLSIYFMVLGRAYWAFFVLGLSTSHFYLTAALWPVYLWYLRGDRTEDLGSSALFKARPFSLGSARFKAWPFATLRPGLYLRFLLFLAVFLLGFFPQIMMYWRMGQNPAVNWGHVEGPGGFVDYLRRKEFGTAFLISNPVLTYHVGKNINQIISYAKTLTGEFAVVLPLFGLATLFAGNKYKRLSLALLVIFFLLTFVQLFLLSTIDSADSGNPFQLNKFYINSFVVLWVLIALGVNTVVGKIGEFLAPIRLFLALLIVVFLMANFKTHDFSKNDFSQKLVSDAYSQLGANSVAITLDHMAYFGGIYEQLVNGKFKDVKIVYIPNEKNWDYQKYYPQLIAPKEDKEFIENVRREFNIGGGEEVALSIIAKNLDKNVYVLMGDFEYNFFRFLRTSSEPWGLWLKARKNGDEVSAAELKDLSANYKNVNIKKADFWLKQQASQTAIYAISYYNLALYLASRGDFDGAMDYFNRSLAVNPDAGNVVNDLNLIGKIMDLNGKFDEMVENRDKERLVDLGQAMFTAQYFEGSANVYEAVLDFTQDDAKVYNNAASAWASLGERDRARGYYQKALEQDPSLDVARKGLEALGE